MFSLSRILVFATNAIAMSLLISMAVISFVAAGLQPSQAMQSGHFLEQLLLTNWCQNSLLIWWGMPHALNQVHSTRAQGWQKGRCRHAPCQGWTEHNKARFLKVMMRWVPAISRAAALAFSDQAAASHRTTAATACFFEVVTAPPRLIWSGGAEELKFQPLGCIQKSSDEMITVPADPLSRERARLQSM